MISDKAYSVAMSAGYIPVPRKDGKPQWEKDFIHPSFWECLSKALGWRVRARDQFHNEMLEYEFQYQGAVMEYSWEYVAKKFYDIILTGGSTDEFWNDLLANK